MLVLFCLFFDRKPLAQGRLETSPHRERFVFEFSIFPLLMPFLSSVTQQAYFFFDLLQMNSVLYFGFLCKCTTFFKCTTFSKIMKYW